MTRQVDHAIRSKAFRDACRRLTIKHIRTKPWDRFQTNGKAERFIQTMFVENGPTPTEFHNSRPAKSRSAEMAATATTGIDPMPSSIDKRPISRLGLNRDNLVEKLHI